MLGRSAYHADGRPITASEPAKRGETIVIYAQGLGQPSTPAPTGDVSRAGGALENIQRRLAASFDNFLNTPSSGPRFAYVTPGPSPIAFAGLTPDEIGLYQINIPVPLSLDLADKCGGLNGFIRSNATLFVSASQGTERLGICVQP